MIPVDWLFSDLIYMALYALKDAVNILAGGLVFLGIVHGLISIVQPLRR